jgi:hypothetical protein
LAEQDFGPFRAPGAEEEQSGRGQKINRQRVRGKQETEKKAYQGPGGSGRNGTIPRITSGRNRDYKFVHEEPLSAVPESTEIENASPGCEHHSTISAHSLAKSEGIVFANNCQEKRESSWKSLKNINSGLFHLRAIKFFSAINFF